MSYTGFRSRTRPPNSCAVEVLKMAPPPHLDKYHILTEIGSGGFATVYRIVDTTLDRVAGTFGTRNPRKNTKGTKRSPSFASFA